jgi:hypothetical protein
MGIRNLIGPRRRLVEALLSEFDEEMADTRKLLECVPDDKLAWKPHEKSFTLGKLANHLAALPVMATFLITGRPRKPSDAASKAEYLEAFDRNVAEFREALSGSNDDRLAESILVSPGVSKTRAAAQGADESLDSPSRLIERVLAAAGCAGARHLRAFGGREVAYE